VLVCDLSRVDNIFEPLFDTHASGVQDHRFVVCPTEAFATRVSIAYATRLNVSPVPDRRDLGGIYLRILRQFSTEPVVRHNNTVGFPHDPALQPASKSGRDRSGILRFAQSDRVEILNPDAEYRTVPDGYSTSQTLSGGRDQCRCRAYNHVGLVPTRSGTANAEGCLHEKSA
jgi:hypothetical protein